MGPVLMILCAPDNRWAQDGTTWVTGPHGQDWIYQVKSAAPWRKLLKGQSDEGT